MNSFDFVTGGRYAWVSLRLMYTYEIILYWSDEGRTLMVAKTNLAAILE